MPGRWMELWRPGLEVSSGFVRDNEVYVAVYGQEPVGFYALIGGEHGLDLEHLWCCRTGSGRVSDGSCSSTRYAARGSSGRGR